MRESEPPRVAVEYTRSVFFFQLLLSLKSTKNCNGRMLRISAHDTNKSTLSVIRRNTSVTSLKTTVNSFNASIKYFVTNTYFLSIVVKRSFFPSHNTWKYSFWSKYLPQGQDPPVKKKSSIAMSPVIQFRTSASNVICQKHGSTV